MRTGKSMLNWVGKRVLVIGAARQGIALARYLAVNGAQVVLNDRKPAEELKAAMVSLANQNSSGRIEWSLGGHPLSLLEGIDLVCPSGGVPLNLPLIQEAIQRGIPLSNDSQIFLDVCPCLTIGITGSAGKTTTTSLVGKIAGISTETRMDGIYHKVWVGGNIGNPLVSVVDEIHPDDLVVMELSSFQLELMTKSVDIACILNITPNHLDRHASMADYIAAKRRILEFQSDSDSAVLGADDPGAWDLLGNVRGRCYAFGKAFPSDRLMGAFFDGEWVFIWDGKAESRIVRLSEIPLRGWHNVENVMAACAVSLAAGLPAPAMREGIMAFTGVPHRLEWVNFWRGADWYNDSIATTPERVMAAIHAFDTPPDFHRPIVLMAGGRDKNLPWDELAELIHARVKHLILFGEAAGRIAAAVGEIKPGMLLKTIESFPGLEGAVKDAARLAEKGDIVLLSPGGTSFDEFRDFEERGEAFKKWVFNLSCM